MANQHTDTNGCPHKPAVGNRYGRLLVIAEAGYRTIPSGQRKRFVRVQCDCGTVLETALHRLREGRTASCGSSIHSRKRTHGMSTARTYWIWVGIKTRCISSGYPEKGARNYRDRGITVCDRWVGPDGFINFLADMGERPAGLTLDRIDNNRGYEPGNCRWTTTETQSRNKRTNVWVEYNGARMVLTDAARAIGIAPQMVSDRVRTRRVTHQQALDYYTLSRGKRCTPALLASNAASGARA